MSALTNLYFRLSRGEEVSLEVLEAPLHGTLDALRSLSSAAAHNGHGSIANNLTPLWRTLARQHNLRHAYELWRRVLGMVYAWEHVSGDQVHKGSFFYFLGMTEILTGALDAGFLCMHQALAEDERVLGVRWPQTAACAFVTLDSQESEQLFRAWVHLHALDLADRLATYGAASGRVMSVADFRARLIQLPDDVAFSFVYYLAKVREIEVQLDQQTMKSEFAAVLKSQTLFRGCLIAEAVMKQKFPGDYFPQLVHGLSQSLGLGTRQDVIQRANQPFQNDFEQTLSDVLDGHYVDTVLQRPFNHDERALCVAYGLRNFGAHNIKSHSVIWRRFRECASCIFDAVFVSIHAP